MSALLLTISVYTIFVLLIAVYVAINAYNLVRFRLDRLENDCSKMMLFIYLTVVITIFFISIIGATISYNL